MSPKPLIKNLLASSLIATCALLGAIAVLPPRAAAQGSNVQFPGSPLLPGPPQVRPRIEIYPSRPLFRRCVDWYELQNRPSGTVLFPQMRCWWVRG
jgi:hypothetical protein